MKSNGSECLNMKLIFYIIFFAFQKTVITRMTPMISCIASELFLSVGDTAELVCVLKNIENFPVIWSKRTKEGGGIQFSFHQSLTSKDNRFSVIKLWNNSTLTYTLKINEVQHSDAGIYSCSVLMSHDIPFFIDVELHVGLKPASITPSTSSVILTSVGESISLECHAQGSPTPTITWYRQNDGSPLKGDDQTGEVFRISKVERNSHGVYHCKANNGIGATAHQKFSVKVEFPPVITCSSDRLIEKHDLSVDIRCQIEANPKPFITWKKSGIVLLPGVQQKISNLQLTSEIYISILQIDRIENYQLGEYICIATNYLGTSRRVISIYDPSARQ